MARRSRTSWVSQPGNILSGAGEGMILHPQPKPGPGTDPVCTCRPIEKGRLGGQRPMLRWKDHQTLMAYCGTCQRDLRGGLHRTRDAVHLLGLAKMPLPHLDLVDLVEAGLMRSEDLEPPVDPWAEARQQAVTHSARVPLGPGVLDPDDLARLERMAQPDDFAALARLVETDEDFSDGALEG